MELFLKMELDFSLGNEFPVAELVSTEAGSF